MKRNFNDIEKKQFDVVVIGGGIHGAAVAWQCSEQGMKVALIEKEDFGSETSANSLKIVHGGFRYLQHLNIKRMRESILSRRIMSQISPHNISALRCAIPNSGFGLKSRLLMRVALFLNDIIGFDRNKDVGDGCKIPRGKIISLQDCKRQYPAVDWHGKTGGAVWYDAIALNSERLTLAFVQKAAENGADVFNYTELKEILIRNKQVCGAMVHDRIAGKCLTLNGASVVVTGGAANDKLLGYHQNRKDIQKKWAKAVNVIVKKPILQESAIGLTGEADYVDEDAVLKKKGRFFFFVPWRGYVMIGTTYTFSHGDDLTAGRDDIEEILHEVNSILPGAELVFQDVTKVHVGLVPAYSKENKEDEVQLVKETDVLDLSCKTVNPVAGLFAVKSVKYTTAPVVAMDVAEKVSGYLRKPYKRTYSYSSPDMADINQRADALQLDSEVVKRYGDRIEKLIPYIRNGMEILHDNPVVYAGEIEYLLEQEMAHKLSDVVFRRTEIGSAECPSPEALNKIAKKMADILNWDENRIEAEIEDVEKTFKWT